MMIEQRVSLKTYNTFSIEATAEQLATIRSNEELHYVIAELEPSTPRFVLGGGSNILLTDDVPGVVLYNQIKGVQLIAETAENVTLQVGAGENWHQLVEHTIDQQWHGLENLSLIPGSVGAAPIQNIGAYGVDFSSVMQSLNAVDLYNGEHLQFQQQDCELGYRDSIFKRQWRHRLMITDVTIQLSKTPRFNLSYRALQQYFEQQQIEPSLRHISQAVIAIRNSKLPNPKDIANAGSFFKNPVVDAATFDTLSSQFEQMPHYQVKALEYKIPAAWLIEQAGLKGTRVADAGSHHQQAVVIVNHAHATGQEIAAFAQQIQQKVFAHFGIQLETEVNILPIKTEILMLPR